MLLTPATPSRAHVCQPDQSLPDGLSGTLLVPSASGLARIELADRSVRSLPLLPSSGVVTAVARAADGRLAVARFSRPAGDVVGGSDLLITGPEAGSPLQAIEREQPGDLLGAPAWLPGGGLVYERLGLAATSAPRLERAAADGSARQLLVERAAQPAVSPDGTLLVFVRTDRSDRLLARPLEGGAERVLVDEPGLLALAFPRFSPDGQWIAFAAASDGPSPGADDHRPATALSALLPKPAAAHGLPWDIYLVRPDGSELRRLTNYYDDDPAPAWSPDGRWLAVFAGESIKLVSADGQQRVCLASSGGYGGLEWLAE